MSILICMNLTIFMLPIIFSNVEGFVKLFIFNIFVIFVVVWCLKIMDITWKNLHIQLPFTAVMKCVHLNFDAAIKKFQNIIKNIFLGSFFLRKKLQLMNKLL